MPNLNLNIWDKDDTLTPPLQGQSVAAQVMGIASPSINVMYNQFIVPSGQRGFTIKGGTWLKMLIPKGAGLYNHLVFGTDIDADFAFAEQLLDSGIAFQAGRDYYIYMCYQPATSSVQLPWTTIMVSLNATYPMGYTEDTSRKIGGFHTICANIGTITGHTISGYNVGDILPGSIWTLKHRPSCTNEGMAYCSELDFWFDVYLPSGYGVNTRSVYGGSITKSQTFSQHVEDLFKVGKTPLSDAEFSCVMEGSNQLTNIAGSADPITTGGHIDTASRRMVSNYGAEDGCGAYWQWLEGWSWRGNELEPGGTGLGYVADPSGKGSVNAVNALVAGGAWAVGVDCGSRARYGSNSRLVVNASNSCRGRARSRNT